jgi:hypothetical protein
MLSQSLPVNDSTDLFLALVLRYDGLKQSYQILPDTVELNFTRALRANPAIS